MELFSLSFSYQWYSESLDEKKTVNPCNEDKGLGSLMFRVIK